MRCSCFIDFCRTDAERLLNGHAAVSCGFAVAGMVGFRNYLDLRAGKLKI